MDVTIRVAPAANASRIPSAVSTPPASWSGTATRAAIAPTASRLPGRPVRAPSKSTRWISRAPRSTKLSAIRSGRSVGAPIPVDAPGQWTTRERPRSRSIAGITCMERGGACGSGARGAVRAAAAAGHPLLLCREPLGEDPAMEADRQRAVVEQRVVEGSQREGAPEPALLVRSKSEQQHLAEQVRQLVGRGVRIAPDLGPGVRLLEARLLDEEPDRLVHGDL